MLRRGIVKKRLRRRRREARLGSGIEERSVGMDDMGVRKLAVGAILVGVSCGCHAQDPMTSLANSHVEANAPKGGEFDESLRRDLKSYFCKGVKDCRVEYEYLREGATESGVAYPKYYLWVKCFEKDKLRTEGAARVSAIEQKTFDVTNFLQAEDIAATPEIVGNTFPIALVDKIVRKANHRPPEESPGRDGKR
jgi:hypothetical protein